MLCYYTHTLILKTDNDGLNIALYAVTVH